jgi:hypothetical protein
MGLLFRARPRLVRLAAGGHRGGGRGDPAFDVLWRDDHDELLDGSRRYELTLRPPALEGSWLLAMYDQPDCHLVANPIDRYSIGDRTPGLRAAADGSVTILLQHESPGPDREANWLPAPPGPFRPILRNYAPGAAILDGSYVLPRVRRVD